MEEKPKNEIARCHEELRKEQSYTQEKKFCDAILEDFIMTARIISIYSSRGGGRDNSLTFKFSDFLFESAVGISLMINEGVINPSKRELRYVLEASVKTLLVDQKLFGKTYQEKTEYFETSIPRSSIDCVDDVKLFFSNCQNKLFIDDVKQLFSELSHDVHPSKVQLREYEQRCSKGASIGLETWKELKRLNALLFRTYEIVLVLSFHALGFNLSGDIFTVLLDDKPKWKFHKGKHMKALSDLYSYKLERK